MNAYSRRRLLATAGAGAVLAGTLGRRALAQTAPIKLGFVSSLSGPAALLAKPQLISAEIAVAQINEAGGLLGRRVELVARDDKSNPNDGVAVVRELSGDGVTLFAGFLVSGVALGVMGVLKDLNGAMVTAGPAATSLTHEQFSPNYFRVNENIYMRLRMGARLMAEKYPDVVDWGVLAPDSELGRQGDAVFRDGMAQFYPEIAKKPAKMRDTVLAKFGATDFKTQIAQLQGQQIQGLFSLVYGNDAVTFLSQAVQLGLTSSLKGLLDNGNELALLKALGKRTPPNIWVATHWYYGAYQDLPMAKALYDAYVQKTGDKYPDGIVCEGHAAIMALANGIQHAGTTDTAAVIGAMEGMTFDTAKGKCTFRKEDHQAIVDLNFMQAQPRDNELGFEIVDCVKANSAIAMDDPSPGKPVTLKYLK